MLCRVCRLMFEGGAQARGYELESIGVEYGRTTRYIHHATTRSLIDSANLYCYICTRVWKDAISHGFSRGPELRWQNSCSTSYVLRTFDRDTLSISLLELLISYARKRRVIEDGPGPEEIVFWTKFMLEPTKTGTVEEVGLSVENQIALMSTGSGAAYDLASKWIFGCISNHTECTQSGSFGKQLPTRLINVGNGASSMVHLYEGNDLLYQTNDVLNPIHEHYMTLSHCWGLAQILTLNKSTYETLKSGINESELPRTFRDAIHFTRLLGIKYIWIDSLCIFQDSVDDWLRESSTMTRIYRQAICNISALASSTSNGGCFRERTFDSIKPCRIDASWDGLPKGAFNIHHDMLWQNNVTAAPLHKRAWVVQERLLAPRVLHFGREQLFWECHSIHACETYPDGLPPGLALSDPSINFKGLNPSIYGENLRKLSNWDCSDSSLNQLYIWEKVVRTYTSCVLTKEQDKLIAISGIAKRVQPLSPNDTARRVGKLAGYHPARYLAGLWDFFLPAQLLWNVKQGSRPKVYRAPSWSWANIDGQVSFHTAFNDGKDHIKIIECVTIPISEDPFGQVSGGYIHLEGYPTLVTLTAMTGYANGEFFSMTINGQSISSLCCADVANEQLPVSAYCLPIRTYRITTDLIAAERLGCLLLVPIGSGGGKYRRWAQVTLENSLDQKAVHRETRVMASEDINRDSATGKCTMTIL